MNPELSLWNEEMTKFGKFYLVVTGAMDEYMLTRTKLPSLQEEEFVGYAKTVGVLLSLMYRTQREYFSHLRVHQTQEEYFSHQRDLNALQELSNATQERQEQRDGE